MQGNVEEWIAVNPARAGMIRRPEWITTPAARKPLEEGHQMRLWPVIIKMIS